MPDLQSFASRVELETSINNSQIAKFRIYLFSFRLNFDFFFLAFFVVLLRKKNGGESANSLVTSIMIFSICDDKHACKTSETISRICESST